MDIFCNTCQKIIGRVPDEKLPPNRRMRVTCPQCANAIFVERQIAEPSIPEPPVTFPAASAPYGAPAQTDAAPGRSSSGASQPAKSRFRLWQAFYLAFFSGDFYQDVCEYWRGKAYTFLAVLVLLTSLPTALALQKDFKTFISGNASTVIAKIPDMRLDNGELTVNIEQPYLIEDDDTGELIAIIDTTGQYTSLDDTDAHILVTQKNVHIRKSNAEIRTYSMQVLGDRIINQEVLRSWVDTASAWVGVGLVPAMVVGSFLVSIIGALFFGAIGLIMAMALRVNLPYSALVSVAIMARTPPTLLETLQILLGTRLLFWGILSFLITIGLLFYAIRSKAADKK